MCRTTRRLRLGQVAIGERKKETESIRLDLIDSALLPFGQAFAA